MIALFVAYLLSIGPAYGWASTSESYPAAMDDPYVGALQVIYYPVDAIADNVPLVGVPLRRYQVLWFRIFSR